MSVPSEIICPKLEKLSADAEKVSNHHQWTCTAFFLRTSQHLTIISA